MVSFSIVRVHAGMIEICIIRLVATFKFCAAEIGEEFCGGRAENDHAVFNGLSY
jgi:hypothetical protein